MRVALEYNFYEELKLSTLDKKLTAEEILAAVDRYITGIRKTYNNVADDVRVILNAKLALEAEMRAFATDKAAQRAHREDLWEKHTAQVRRLAAIMKGGAGEEAPAVLRARLTRLAGHFDLELGAVKKVFEESGYTVIANKSAPLDKIFTEETSLRDINKALERIRATLQAEQASPGAVRHVPDQMAGVRTLYEYLAVQRGEGSAEMYKDPRRTSAEQLCRMFNELLSQSNRIENQEPFMSFKTLEAVAATRVFHTDESRHRYDRTLQFAPVMDTLNFIATLPEAVKSDRSFAESIIERIQRDFPDEDTAIAIYNKYVKLPAELGYEKERVEIRTMCRCGRVNVHRTLEQAQKARCVNCGEPLYRPCPSCGAPLSGALDVCGCGYYLPDFAAFQTHQRLCMAALKRYDLGESRKELALVQRCRPKSADISRMEQTVEALEEKLGKRLSAIGAAIDSGQLEKAAASLADLQQRCPSMNLERWTRRLASAREAAQKNLARADREYQMIQTLSGVSAKVEACLRILAYAPDYPPVLALLGSPELRPRKVLRVRAVPDHSGGRVSLSWEPNPEDLSVTYRVVRKEEGFPIGPGDGAEVASGLKTAGAVDKDLRPGVGYGYAVFAVRRNACSEPAPCAKPVFLMPGLNRSKVSYTLNGTSCTLRWEDVPGSRGVLVERAVGSSGASKELSECARAAFTDRDLMQGTHYRYILSTVWNTRDGRELLSSESVEVEVDAVVRPAALNAEKVSESPGGLCKIRWAVPDDGAGEAIAVELYVADSVRKDQEYDFSALPALGKKLAGAPASAGAADLNIGPGRGADIVLLRPFGSRLVAGQPLRLSTLAPLRVDWSGLRVERSAKGSFAVSVPCTDIPKEVESLRIAAAGAGGGRAEGTVSVKGRPAAELLLDCGDLPEGEAMITVLGTTARGFQTPPVCHKALLIQKAEVRYRLVWSKRRMIARRMDQLYVEGTVTGAPRKCRPLCLCASRTGFFGEDMRYYNKEKMTWIADIEPVWNGKFRVELSGLALEAIGREDRLELLARPEDRDQFQILCDNPTARQRPV